LRCKINMKVKNMTQEHQSTYVKQYSYKKDKLTNGLFTGVLALVFAMIAVLFTNRFLVCIFSILSLVFAGGEVLAKLTKGSKKSKTDDTILILIAILVLFFAGRFEVAAIAISLYRIFSIFIMYISGKLGRSIKDIVDVLPEYANLVDDGMNVQKVPSASLGRGAKIMIKNGETVPVDCVVLDGFADFDASNVTKNKDDVSVSPGDKILAGYINMGATVTCEAVCDYEESIVIDMNRLAAMAESSSAKSHNRFMALAKWYPPAVLLIAIVTILIGGLVNGAWITSIERACVLLIVATTGSYVSTVPLLTACAVWNLKKKGLALSSGDLIDEFADINYVAFEKNGILTDGAYAIKEVYTAEGISEEDFLMIAGNCIGGRANAISKILTPYMNPYIPVENTIEFAGKGVECSIMGKLFLCGSKNFMKECNVDVKEISDYTIYVAIDGVLMGAMLIQDTIRPNTGELLRKLRQTGVEKIVMLSSERKETAELAYSDCGADDYFAELTSYTRAETIQKLKAGQDITCAYVGDATSGIQALDAADVPITLISEDDNNLEYAKSFLLGNLDSVADAIEYARLTSGKVELHFYCASAVKIILTLFALFGAVNIIAAIFLESILTILGILSAKDLIKK